VAPGGLAVAGKGIRSTQPGNLFEDAGHGTSYATPHVTGAIALLLELRNNLDPDAIRDHLIACSRSIDANLGPNEQGAGLLDLLAVNPPA
jgi:subtilisin family serine protease